jgi:hypothetical protein
VGFCAFSATRAKILQSTPERTACSAPQTCDQVLVFYSGGYEHSARSLHFSEQCFAGFVDEDDFLQIDERACLRRPFPRLLPTGAQFIDPRTRQAAAQIPELTVGSVGVRNSKHWDYLFAGFGRACRRPKATRSF